MTQAERSSAPPDPAPILIVGALPPPQGGTTVSLAALVAFIRDQGRDVVLVDCAVRSSTPLRTLGRTIRELVHRLHDAAVVSIHLSDRGALTAGIVFWLLARLWRKPVIFRPFGGSFAESLAAVPRWWQFLVRHTLLASDVVLLQTKAQLDALRAQCRDARWFPTARKEPKAMWRGASDASGCMRCLFIGHVRVEKGVLDAVAAVAEVPECTLDVFGPLMDVERDRLAVSRVQYHGELPAAEVADTMSRYDVLLFPSYYPGEGYSGVVIEAAQVGLPIVLSNWKALPEMLPSDAAFFVPPRSVPQLAETLRTLVSNRRLLTQYSAAARHHASAYSAQRVFGSFVALCDELARSQHPVEGV